jgi:hypothetical protein
MPVRLLSPAITADGSGTIQHLARVILVLNQKQRNVVLSIERRLPVGIEPIGLPEFNARIKQQAENIDLLRSGMIQILELTSSRTQHRRW